VSQPHINRVFFAGSGSESNDTVVRMVRTYWDLMGQPQRHTIISRKNAYHGSTVAAASLGGMKPMHRQSGLPIPGIEHIDQPYWFGSDRSLSPDEFGLATARALEDKIRELGADKVAAFIGEPVQGAGGVIIPPATYWPEIQRICDEYGILLISDEVITGFGRLGEWFGADYYGIKPDLMPFAKGVTSGYLPLGGVLVGDRVADVMIDKGGEFFHGYTYSGHPAACAVAIANIQLLREQGLVDRVKNDIGPYLQERWARLAEHPLVGETRMVGLMGALELVANKETLERFPEKRGAGTVCRDIFVENGLVLRAVGDTMVCAPPLVLRKEEADELVDKTWTCLDLAAKSLGS
jgi:putrescine aminotransferase